MKAQGENYTVFEELRKLVQLGTMYNGDGGHGEQDVGVEIRLERQQESDHG